VRIYAVTLGLGSVCVETMTISPNSGNEEKNFILLDATFVVYCHKRCIT
jgi:hypothetical protein